MATTKKQVPKASNCDETISAVLDSVVDKNVICTALVGYKITDKHVILTFDDEKCSEANA
jgi:hypothetical protein